MSMQRRDFLRFSSMGIAGGILAAGSPELLAAVSSGPDSASDRDGGTFDWEEIRSRFPIDRSYVHMAGLFLASHPEPVGRAVQGFRELLDANPVLEVMQRWGEANETRRVAADYMGARSEEVGLTGSTTMGLAITVHGLRVPAGSELLHTTHDHSVANRSVEFKGEHAGASVRRISLYDDAHPELANEPEIVSRLEEALRPETRLFLATWVHSKNGVKLPIAAMSEVIARANASRAEEDRIVFVVDGVHGFGIEDVDIPSLGCDLFSAGTHKWIFGPRGTGVLWGHRRVHDRVTPIIPAVGGGGGWGGGMTPGGFHAFEHRWALGKAFEFHREIGKRRVQERIHELNEALKEGLRGMDHVRLYTPISRELSSGLVCFEVAGLSQSEVVDRLLDDHRIIASTTPYSPSFARFTAGLLNDEEEVERCLAAVHAMA